MILYIADNNKIDKYYLPDTSNNEKSLFKYIPTNSQSEFVFTVFSNNGKWYFKNDANISINNTEENNTSTLLTANVSYPVHIMGYHTTPILFCCSSHEKHKRCFQITEDLSILIGNDKSCQIFDSPNYWFSTPIKIELKNNKWYITDNEDPKCYLYVNNRKYNQKPLKRGDVIFINGTKIVWMKDFIKIQDISHIKVRRLVAIKNPELSNYIEDDNNEENLTLYNEKDYFYHKPYLKNTIIPKIVKIDPPPRSEVRDELPGWLSFGSRLTMIVFSLVMVLNAYNTYLRTQDIAASLPAILMATAMIVGSILFPMISSKYQKRQSKKREKLRQDKYCEYLSTKTNEIKELLEKEKQTLFENNPNVYECEQLIQTNKQKIWTRVITDDDFLTVRVGTGTIKSSININAPQKRFELYEDNLAETLYKLVNDSTNLYDVPITTSFSKNPISAIISDQNYINSIMLQLLTHHSSSDLKLVILTSEANKQKWDYLKTSFHCWNDEKTLRYFATNLEDMKKLNAELERVLSLRKQQKSPDQDDVDSIDENVKMNQKNIYINFKTYYLIIIDNYKDAKTLSLINELTDMKTNYGFSLIFITNSIQELPNTCNNFIYVNPEKNVNCVLQKRETTKIQTNFEPDCDTTLDLTKSVSILSNIPIATSNTTGSTLPTSISFLEMYRIVRIEQLNILNKWQTSNPIDTLRAPIGVYASGDTFYLDLHEKSHGPHGLVAGSTGSGKSEFLITYILSMALNYHPNDVQFVLIDYKGGGLAGAFENRDTGQKIPHLAGTITNLDSSSINRTLVSIESELKRRQAQFNKVRNQTGESTIDIYKYQKLYHDGVIDEPIPHLIIISDEFAELKQQQPEFMTQLISTARIGRSLGVHLILATQKPSGVVNDQIWSNSKFKICLRVQSRQDSMEMLKREEAASIKETGRFYLQVGYNEIFEEGQSAWCGAPYIPSDKLIKKTDNSVDFVDNIGHSIKKIENSSKIVQENSQGEQLTNLVKYIIDAAEQENIKTNYLWLEPLAKEIYITNLQKKYNFKPKPYVLETIIGEYDNPANQMQGLATINLTDTGNIAIYGEPGSGKENQMYSIISSLIITHTSSEVNFYLIDYASETMKMFSKLPHVGDVIYSNDSEKLINLITYITNEINRRKVLFEEYMGSYKNYNERAEKKLPQIIVMVAGFDVLTENNLKIYDIFSSLFRDSNKYGVYFVISTTNPNGIRSRVAQLFANKICFRLEDKTDYRNLLNAPRNVFPADNFGRGLISINEQVFEFQTAVLCPNDSFNKAIIKYAEEYEKTSPVHAPKIKILPEHVLVSDLIKKNMVTDLHHIPIGISKHSLNTINIDLTFYKTFPIIGSFLDEDFTFITGLIEELRIIPNVKVRVIDLSGICNFNIENVPIYNKDFDTVIQQIDMELDKDEKAERTTVFVFVGIGTISTKISKNLQPFIEKIFNRINLLNHTIFILTDNYMSYRNLEVEKWYQANVQNTTGVWLGKDVTNQMSIKISNFNINDSRTSFKDMAFFVNKGKPILMKHIVDKIVEEDDYE